MPGIGPQVKGPPMLAQDQGGRGRRWEHLHKVLRGRGRMVGRLLLLLVVGNQGVDDGAEGVKFVVGVQVALKGEVQRVIHITPLHHVEKRVAFFKTFLDGVHLFPVDPIGQGRVYFDLYLFVAGGYFWQRLFHRACKTQGCNHRLRYFVEQDGEY